jgi:membrane-bound metal-dependent hydrolase YbcI (DUF457 family)
MKSIRFEMSIVSFLCAFVIGVILFAVIWRIFLGSASNNVVLAGMTGVATVVIVFWINHHKKSKP